MNQGTVVQARTGGLAALALLAGSLSAYAIAHESAGAELANQPWVAPYHPCYQWSEVAANQVPWDSVTHLILGYLLPQAQSPGNYTVVPPSWYGNPAWFGDAQPYITAGHLAGRKVTCMLGGAGSNPGGVWNQATSEANVAAFAANITSLLQPLGFDGVDLDWEDGVDYAGLVRLAQRPGRPGRRPSSPSPPASPATTPTIWPRQPRPSTPSCP